MKRIPKAFQMGPHRVEVHLVSEAEMREACKRTGSDFGALEAPPRGLTDFEGYTLYVQKAGRGFSKSSQMHAFWHEYMHMLFWSVGRERLSRDETLVDNCGAMQLQAFQTAEF